MKGIIFAAAFYSIAASAQIQGNFGVGFTSQWNMNLQGGVGYKIDLRYNEEAYPAFVYGELRGFVGEKSYQRATGGGLIGIGSHWQNRQGHQLSTFVYIQYNFYQNLHGYFKEYPPKPILLGLRHVFDGKVVMDFSAGYEQAFVTLGWNLGRFYSE